jgi:hypothetical protein
LAPDRDASTLARRSSAGWEEVGRRSVRELPARIWGPGRGGCRRASP